MQTPTPKQAADQLTLIAQQTEATGHVPLARLATLLTSLGAPRAKTASKDAAVTFRQIAAHLTAPGTIDRQRVVADLRRLYAESLIAEAEVEAGAGEDFQKANPAITDEEAKRIDLEHLKNKDKLKGDKSAAAGITIADAMEDIERDMLQMARPMSLVAQGTEQVIDDLMEHSRIKSEAKGFGEAVKDMADAHEKAEKALVKLMTKIAQGDEAKEGADKEARFPAGKPADPTKHMSEEDAKVWADMNDKYKDVVKDQYKSASVRQKEAAEVGLALAQRGIHATYGGRHGHGFWVDQRWVDMKAARSLLDPTPAPEPVTCPGLAWGVE